MLPPSIEASAATRKRKVAGAAAAAVAAGHVGMEFLVSCLPPPFLQLIFALFSFICSSLVLDAHVVVISLLVYVEYGYHLMIFSWRAYAVWVVHVRVFLKEK
jgi:TRAP-type C4-dicarboxylate transport system permease small subunit